MTDDDDDMAAAEAAAGEAEAHAEIANVESEEQYQLRVELLENFFDALGRKRNRDILNFLLEAKEPKKFGAVLKFCITSKDIHTPSNKELRDALQLMNAGGLVLQNEDRSLVASPFAEMALAAIGVALDKLELITSN